MALKRIAHFQAPVHTVNVKGLFEMTLIEKVSVDTKSILNFSLYHEVTFKHIGHDPFIQLFSLTGVRWRP